MDQVTDRFRMSDTDTSKTYTDNFITYYFVLSRGLMLPGAMDGIRFYVTPDFSKLTNFTVWVEACVQVCSVLLIGVSKS